MEVQKKHPVGERIREIGYKKSAIAARVGLDPRIFADIYTGRTVPDKNIRVQLARILMSTERALWPELFTYR